MNENRGDRRLSIDTDFSSVTAAPFSNGEHELNAPHPYYLRQLEPRDRLCNFSKNHIKALYVTRGGSQIYRWEVPLDKPAIDVKICKGF